MRDGQNEFGAALKDRPKFVYYQACRNQLIRPTRRSQYLR